MSKRYPVRTRRPTSLVVELVVVHFELDSTPWQGWKPKFTSRESGGKERPKVERKMPFRVAILSTVLALVLPATIASVDSFPARISTTKWIVPHDSDHDDASDNDDESIIPPPPPPSMHSIAQLQQLLDEADSRAHRLNETLMLLDKATALWTSRSNYTQKVPPPPPKQVGSTTQDKSIEEDEQEITKEEINGEKEEESRHDILSVSVTLPLATPVSPIAPPPETLPASVTNEVPKEEQKSAESVAIAEKAQDPPPAATLAVPPPEKASVDPPKSFVAAKSPVKEQTLTYPPPRSIVKPSVIQTAKVPVAKPKQAPPTSTPIYTDTVTDDEQELLNIPVYFSDAETDFEEEYVVQRSMSRTQQHQEQATIKQDTSMPEQEPVVTERRAPLPEQASAGSSASYSVQPTQNEASQAAGWNLPPYPPPGYTNAPHYPPYSMYYPYPPPPMDPRFVQLGYPQQQQPMYPAYPPPYPYPYWYPHPQQQGAVQRKESDDSKSVSSKVPKIPSFVLKSHVALDIIQAEKIAPILTKKKEASLPKAVPSVAEVRCLLLYVLSSLNIFTETSLHEIHTEAHRLWIIRQSKSSFGRGHVGLLLGSVSRDIASGSIQPALCKEYEDASVGLVWSRHQHAHSLRQARKQYQCSDSLLLQLVCLWIYHDLCSRAGGYHHCETGTVCLAGTECVQTLAEGCFACTTMGDSREQVPTQEDNCICC